MMYLLTKPKDGRDANSKVGVYENMVTYPALLRKAHGAIRAHSLEINRPTYLRLSQHERIEHLRERMKTLATVTRDEAFDALSVKLSNIYVMSNRDAMLPFYGGRNMMLSSSGHDAGEGN